MSHAFHPSQVTGLFAFWTADNVVLSGGVVSEMPDVSGNNVKARNLVKVTTGPTYTASDPTFNFQPSVSSNAANVRLHSTFDTTLAQPSTVYLVMNVSNAGNGMFWRTNAGNFLNSTGLFINGTTPTAVMQVRDTAALAVTSPSALAGTKHVTCAIYNTTASALYVDNSQATFAVSPTHGSVDNDGCTAMTIGNFGTAVPYSWTTMICYSGTHDADTRRRVMAWLGLRYGITIV